MSAGRRNEWDRIWAEAERLISEANERLKRKRKRRRIERELERTFVYSPMAPLSLSDSSSSSAASSPSSQSSVASGPEAQSDEEGASSSSSSSSSSSPSSPPEEDPPNTGRDYTPSEKGIVRALKFARVVFFGRNGEWIINLEKFKTHWDNTDVDTYYDPIRHDENRLKSYIRRMKRVQDDDMPSVSLAPHPGNDPASIAQPGAPYAGVNVEIITFDTKGVNNLRMALLLYLLRRMSVLAEHAGFGTERFKVMYQTNVESQIGRVMYVIPDEIIIRNKLVNWESVLRVFLRLTGEMYNSGKIEAVSDDDRIVDRDSGEVIALISHGGQVSFYITFLDMLDTPIGTRWVDEIVPVLEQAFEGHAIAGVKNRADKLCLLYTIVMGYAALKWGMNLFSRKKWFEVEEVENFLADVSDANDPGKKLMMDIRRGRAGSEMEDIIKDEMRTYSTKELYQILRNIEARYVDKEYAIEVYAAEINGQGRVSSVYPCYVSARQTDKRIRMLNIRFGTFSHYFLITSARALWKYTGSKIFYTCETCNLTFFTRYGLMNHEHGVDAKHPPNHWSRLSDEDDPSRDCVGICQRCHLMFAEEADYEYHMEHCFMSKRTGTRYVCLSKDSVLRGGCKEGESEELEDKSIFFADFECCILPDGSHEFMSYGMYDVKGDRYYSGFSMDEFIELLKEFSDERENIFVYFHNAMNYDANFIIRYILDKEKSMTITVIMKSINRLQSVQITWKKAGCKTLKRIKIGDTFQFMTMSLERIVNSVRSDDITKNTETFKHFFSVFERKYDLGPLYTNAILKKNLFPYYFFDSYDKLDTPISEFKKIFAPLEENKKYFSESVTLDEIRENQPEFLSICSDFDIRTACQYHDLYLCCDVMQITDIFLNARRTLFGTHHIDICDYIGMPSASWHAFLRLSPDLELPLYTNTRFAEFFSSMTRGGVTSAVLRYAKADDTHKILYLDVNGLYPFVMQKYLYPCGTMRWVNFGEEENFNPSWFFMNQFVPMLEHMDMGACLCVDLINPPPLHKKTQQFPFAPDHTLIKSDYFDRDGELYPFLARWSMANEGAKMPAFTGLVGTLYDKKQYGVHWKLLEWYVNHGMIIGKLHYAVVFQEGDYLKDYVQLNIGLRNKRTDELGKMVYKLMGNSIYGKTFESPFNRSKYLIVRNREKLKGLLEEGNVEQLVSLNEECCIVKLGATEVVLNKPTYIGACVTEYAKLHMYQLFYDKLGGIFGDGLELVYTDTDSFIIRVKHEPGWTTKQVIDYINTKCPGLIGKLGGQIKSETGEDDSIDEVVALRSKLYAYKTLKGAFSKHAKGVTAAAQKNQLTWEDYVRALVTLQAIPTSNVQFKRQAMKIKTVKIMKDSLTVNDGKRMIDPDGIHTKPFGYVEYEEEELTDDDDE